MFLGVLDLGFDVFHAESVGGTGFDDVLVSLDNEGDSLGDQFIGVSFPKHFLVNIFFFDHGFKQRASSLKHLELCVLNVFGKLCLLTEFVVLLISIP